LDLLARFIVIRNFKMKAKLLLERRLALSRRHRVIVRKNWFLRSSYVKTSELIYTYLLTDIFANCNWVATQWQ
jgi:hypothetical protein